MKKGYRTNSLIAFSSNLQTANFGVGKIIGEGINKVDDAIRWGSGHASEQLGKIGADKGFGFRHSIGQSGKNLGDSAWQNANKIRNGLGIGAGVGAVGLGGMALGSRGQKPNQQRQPGM
jgi:hypothetical protein